MQRHKKHRGRIAPSPTGYLHLGHARTFWTAQQRARAASGTLVFRNEDLDIQRCRPEFVSAMYEDLRWLGLEWQEEPEVGGPFAPYSQSERREFYLAAWRRLRDAGAIFPCTCSRKDLEQALSAPHDDADEIPYPGICRNKQWSPEKFQSPAGVSWRFRVLDGRTISFEDALQGETRFWLAKTSLTFWFGDAMTFPLTSWHVWWTTTRCRSPRLFAGLIC